MDINNTLFKTLLRKQNITEFRAFRIDPSSISNPKLDNSIKIDYQYVNLNNLYAYIKDDIFHICNEKFEDIKLSDIYFPEKGLHRIGYNDDEYYYPITDKVNSVVVNSDGRIVFRNPKEYFYIGTKEFIEDVPTFLNEFEEGLLYDFINNKYITPPSFNFWEGYKENYNASTPKIANINPIVNGIEENNLSYLFSVKKEFINPPHTISYFTNSANKSIVYFESSKYGSDKKELKPVCLWYTNGTVFAISIRLINKFDSEENIISLDDAYSHSISFEVKVNSGKTFDCGASTILEFCGRLDNKYDLEYFYNHLEFIPTKNSLLILFSDNYRNSYHTIIINEIGFVTLCKHLECSSVALTENNILRLGNFESDSADYCDIFGTRFCTADKHSPKFQIFTRNLREPNTFNSKDINAQRTDNRRRFYDDGVYSQLEGVIDLQSGNIIVPPCYSKIQLREFTRDFEDYLDTPIYVSIVQIDNFFNGQLKSYFGIYQNDKLAIPINYSNIHFIEYKSPKERIYDIRELDDDRCFKKHESIFILLERNGLYGLASQFGSLILEPCADSYRILVETKRIPIKNEDNNIYLHHIPNIGPEYIALCKNGSYNLIYRDQIISDFTIDEFELLSLDVYGDELFFIKVFCNSKEALVYNGKFITDFYAEVSVSCSEFGNPHDSIVNNFVITVIDDEGNASLLNCKSQTLIEFSSHHINPFLNYVKVDSKILDINNNIIFDAENHTLIDEKKGPYNNHILCFHDENSPSVYIVISTDGEVVKINTDEDSEEIEFNVGGFNNYYFNTDILRFENVPVNEEESDDDYCHDYYPDDTDYDRDTYYALGGDDYDAFKERGGSLDDMMDGMGF